MSDPHTKHIEQPALPYSFPVVGVGASAGGLEAFKRLIKALPENPGIALILVQHLEPTHESMLTDLLQKVTKIPVHEITDNVVIESNHIYIIPPNRSLTAFDGRLQLSPRPPKDKKHMPIDVFFTSLAEVHQEQAIGVVLSGSAADGTLGLKQIKDQGGLTFAQDPQSATFGSMPQSAIDAGVADFVLPPEQIALQLGALTKTLRNGILEESADGQQDKKDAFKELLNLLRIRKGTDFTYYKQTTIQRRIVRRMGLNKIERLADYSKYFKENATEQELLYQDLLIPVTGFFRDPQTYETLSESVFPLLFNGREFGSPLRIWIAGCATGEEPYSIAMSLHEWLGDRIADRKIQIFASDVSEVSVSKARGGVYSKREVAGLSEERLHRFFVKINGSFQINKSIRDMCIFARHNFLKDPPFAKMDVISCRNVLIYMESFLQKKALTTFHYALNENGYLWLGKSETIAPAADLFVAFRKADKLYSRKSVPAKISPVASDSHDRASTNKPDQSSSRPGRDDFQKSADELLLARYTPSGVVINEQMDIVQFRGSTGAWLEPSPGKPSLNVLRMVREGLSFELRNALSKAKANNKAETKEHIPVQVLGVQKRVTLEVIPLPNTVEPYYLILFRDELPVPVTKSAADNGSSPAERQKSAEGEHIEQLEMELAQLREDMKAITEDQDAANEELQSTNEELLSGSEELQSLNEELETSKEEIQSTNEELTTLNQELFDRNEQLNLSRIYAESIVATIREPLIVLDKDMKVKTANPAWYKKFGASEEQTEGRLLYGLGNGQWDLHELRKMLENLRVMSEKITDFEINYIMDGEEQRVLLLNASRIFREDDTELVLLVAIEDVTEARKRETDLREFSQELEEMVEERTFSLKEANIALAQSNANLEQYATIASHDLQEPLRKIRTFSALLNRRHSLGIAGEAKELLQKIDLAAERMSILIEDVLNFSKLLGEGVFENTDLNVILRNVIGDFELRITEERAVIDAGRLPVIQAVPLQMNQLFYNLLSNALKFSRPGEPPVIHISGKPLPVEEIRQHPALKENKKYVEIIFEDNGIGFDQQFSRQIFQIFQRLHRNEQFEGTGIGLALCEKIVSNHHGDISAGAEEGKGASFRIILPLEQ
jgi:two-component system, chemotaxis family, CheB/CheR fusion protein